MGSRANTMNEPGKFEMKGMSILDGKQIKAYVSRILEKEDIFLDLGRLKGSPLYVIDESALLDRAREFCAAFQNRLNDVRFYYAVKSNNHPSISRILIKNGFGLDVSSGEELLQAVKLHASDIIFSGPGKTTSELMLATKYYDRIKVMVDSFGELDRLEQAARELDKQVQIGVRLCVDENGLWRKFGIPLSELARFIDLARSFKNVTFRGLQFHTSWNLNSDAQISFIRRLGESIGQLGKEQRSLIKFIDIGGGYWPPQGEWLQPEVASKTQSQTSVLPDRNYESNHLFWPSISIDSFARQIAGAIHKYIHPLVEYAIYVEPGRWICHDAMHILLTVLDKKVDDLVITDGGTNAVGWERFESDYFPVINMTRPALTEHKCLITGSLCTPHDIWGFGYFGSGIEPGDILVIPSQGAYTYSLRQHFIKPLPKVMNMGKNESPGFLAKLGIIFKRKTVVCNESDNKTSCDDNEAFDYIHREILWERIKSSLPQHNRNNGDDFI